MFKKAVDNANTEDIIYSLCIAVPGAIEQAKKFNLPEIIGLQGANLIADATLTGKWIRANVTYKIDEFGHQNIQFPSALLRNENGKGDCKSISLLYLSIMEAAGWNGGFRFASYKNGTNFTHVYNFFLDDNNNLYTFDACIKDLKEVKKYKKIKDMQVNYIAGIPTMINEETKIMRSQPVRIRKEKRIQLGYIDDVAAIGKKKGGTKKLGNFIKKGFQKIKTTSLAPARGPFLLLVGVNFRGLARKLNDARSKGADKFQEWWLKLGGNIDKLNKAIDKGKDKKPLLGEKKISGVGEQDGVGVVVAASTTAAITAAAGIIASAAKLFSSLGIGNKKGEEDVDAGIDPDTPVSPDVEKGEDFFANDPASKEADSYATSGGVVKPSIKASTKGLEATSDVVGFKPSPLLIAGGIGAIAIIFMLTKKGKK